LQTPDGNERNHTSIQDGAFVLDLDLDLTSFVTGNYTCHVLDNGACALAPLSAFYEVKNVDVKVMLLEGRLARLEELQRSCGDSHCASTNRPSTHRPTGNSNSQIITTAAMPEVNTATPEVNTATPEVNTAAPEVNAGSTQTPMSSVASVTGDLECEQLQCPEEELNALRGGLDREQWNVKKVNDTANAYWRRVKDIVCGLGSYLRHDNSSSPCPHHAAGATG
jgi:hypothetical protein